MPNYLYVFTEWQLCTTKALRVALCYEIQNCEVCSTLHHHKRLPRFTPVFLKEASICLNIAIMHIAFHSNFALSASSLWQQILYCQLAVYGKDRNIMSSFIAFTEMPVFFIEKIGNISMF